MAKALQKKEIEVKAIEYDKLEEKKIQLLETPKPIKITTKKSSSKRRRRRRRRRRETESTLFSPKFR